MSYSYKTTSSSTTIDENKKKTTLLKDNSWIKRADYEDELVDDDPNFGKGLLNRSKTGQTIVSSTDPEPVKSTKPANSSTSVHSLSKRFGVPLDEPKTSSSTKTSTSYTRRYTSGPSSTTTTTVTEDPKTSTKTTTVTKDGTTTETTILTSQNIKSPVVTSPTKTETFSERVKSSSKGAQFPPYSPTKTTTKVTSTKEVADKPLDSVLQSSLKDEDLANLDKTTSFTTTETVTVKSSSDAIAEDNLYDILIPSTIRDGDSNSSTVTTTRTVTVKSSPDSYAGDKLYDSLIPTSAKDDAMNGSTKVTSSQTVTVRSSSKENTKTTTTTKTSLEPKDELYGSYRSKTITSDASSPISSQSPVLSTPTSTRSLSYSSYTDDTPPRSSSYSESYSKTYSYSRPDTSYEYTSITSPSLYTSSSYKSSRLSDDSLADPIYTKSSTKSVYQSERPVLEKDLCTSCRKPFTGDAKMILDDMKINCHATCFKCDVCNTSLSNMKAGDSMWIYKRTVHCENCFETTRDKWRR